MYKKALEFITKRHLGQKRYNGNPFIIHPIRVSQEVTTENQKIIALLHDVLEDTGATRIDLEQFGVEICTAVDCLTHRKGESYLDYINRVKQNPDAVAVKLADIVDNLSDSPSDHMIEKSARALEILIS